MDRGFGAAILSDVQAYADENRNYLLEAGFPQRVVSLLEGYAESLKPEQSEPLPLSIPDLKIVKTSIGVLLNASLGYGTPSPPKDVSLDPLITWFHRTR